jgi:hypothetical protein
MVSSSVRLAEVEAVCVPALMSLRSVMEEVRRGPMSRRSRKGLLGNVEMVVFRVVVAVLMVVIAATIAAPSARAWEVRGRRGRSERCILVVWLVLFYV